MINGGKWPHWFHLNVISHWRRGPFLFQPLKVTMTSHFKPPLCPSREWKSHGHFFFKITWVTFFRTVVKLLHVGHQKSTFFYAKGQDLQEGSKYLPMKCQLLNEMKCQFSLFILFWRSKQRRRWGQWTRSPKSAHYLSLVFPHRWLQDQSYSSYELAEIVLFFLDNSMSFSNIPRIWMFKEYA